jgi:hypothetical protein
MKRCKHEAVRGRERDIVECCWDHHVACSGRPTVPAAYDDAMKAKAKRYVGLKFGDATGQDWADMAGDHARMT